MGFAVGEIKLASRPMTAGLAAGFIPEPHSVPRSAEGALNSGSPAGE